MPADPWTDPLTAPLPSELERLGSVSSRARTDMFPPSEQTLREERTQQPPQVSKPRRRRVPVRRVKRQLKHVDPLTVLKLSGFYWAVFLVVWLVIVAILYSIIEAAGFFDSLEKLNNGFALGWGKLDITLGLVEKWAFLVGITFALITTLVNVFLAFLYNVAADLIGGLELTFVERDTQ
ncbi:MAG TPA: DUF3566 domain-containing protein [Actinomycetota bacterium]|nr:DUF3566 domain-containing protein [Actinomycetota bacterium]